MAPKRPVDAPKAGVAFAPGVAPKPLKLKPDEAAGVEAAPKAVAVCPKPAAGADANPNPAAEDAAPKAGVGAAAPNAGADVAPKPGAAAPPNAGAAAAPNAGVDAPNVLPKSPALVAGCEGVPKAPPGLPKLKGYKNEQMQLQVTVLHTLGS